jgi:hypothetical protein
MFMPDEVLALDKIARRKISESPHAAVACPIYFRNLSNAPG